MIWFILVGSAVVFMIAVALRWHARNQLAALSMAGEVVYSGEAEPYEVLVSALHGLIGRPDYIRQESDELIPVERKSRVLSASGVHEGELLQLAAYCLLVEERYRKRVLRGQLQYQNRSLDIPFDDKLRGRLLATMAEIKAARLLADVPRNHNSQSRCRGCGFRKTCGDSLA